MLTITTFLLTIIATRKKEEWNADKILEILTPNSLVHINWISHFSIIECLKWRINCKFILTKHCIPWRDLIIGDYINFQKVNKSLKNGLASSIKWASYQRKCSLSGCRCDNHCHKSCAKIFINTFLNRPE